MIPNDSHFSWQRRESVLLSLIISLFICLASDNLHYEPIFSSSILFVFQMNLCSRWEAAWEALDLATENSKQSANFLLSPLLICQKKKDHLVTVHIQSLSSVVPTGGSVKCQQDCQLVLNTLLPFLGGVGSSSFILNSEAPPLPCCLQAISLICIWLTCYLLLVL